MKKSIKVFAVVFVALLCMFTLSFATDINMNLPSGNAQGQENMVSNELVSGTNDANGANEVSNDRQSSTLANTPSTTVSSSAYEAPLSFSNILNIILIVVGVVLILLGIAILIRMHS